MGSRSSLVLDILCSEYRWLEAHFFVQRGAGYQCLRLEDIDSRV